MNWQTNHQRPRAGRHALMSSILLAILLSTTVMAWAWSPSPLPLTSRALMSPSPSTSLSASTAEAVDELYYTPNSSSSNPISTIDINAEGTTSEELEIAARNYGTSATNNVPPGAKITLTRWLSAKVNDYPELRDMESLHLSIQMACKTISNLIHSSTTASGAVAASSGSNARDNSMKRLDQISKNVLQNALRFTGRLRVVEAPRSSDNNDEDCSITDDDCPKTHQPGVTIAYALDQYGKSSSSNRVMTRQETLLRKLGGDAQADAKWGNTRRLAACFDPLDGSGNADAQGATGTVVSFCLIGYAGIYDAMTSIML